MDASPGIISILFIVLILGGLIVGITLWITGSRSKKTGDMSCGSCGYAVRGLEGLNCPECGADLRMAGINRPKGGAARVAGIVITIITSLLILTCLGSAVFLTGSNSISTSPSIQTGPPPNVSSSSQVTQNPDGTQTIIDPDGTTRTFNVDGVEIETPTAPQTETP